MYALQSNREKLSAVSHFYLLDDDAFRTVVDKQATYQLCEQEQIPYPHTVPIKSLSAFDDVADTFRHNIIVKPSCSVNAEQTFGKAYVRRCRTPEEAREYVAYLLEHGIAALWRQPGKSP